MVLVYEWSIVATNGESQYLVYSATLLSGREGVWLV
jgi:hypothetical protein